MASRYDNPIPTRFLAPIDCSKFKLYAKTPRFSYPYGTVNFMAMLGIRILITNSCTRCRWIFKGISQDEGRTDFSENRRAFSLMMAYQRKLLSARSISLDSTFKVEKQFEIINRNCVTFRELKFRKKISPIWSGKTSFCQKRNGSLHDWSLEKYQNMDSGT